MNYIDKIKKLKTIEKVANDILQSDIDSQTKYNLIFSDKISRKVFDIYKEINISFDYYDPDTSYEEDAHAFISALREHNENLQKNIHIFEQLTNLK